MKFDPSILARARKNHNILLVALSSVTQTTVAQLLNESDSTTSRFKSAELERFAGMLAAVGLKVVNEGDQFMSETRRKSLCEMASIGVEALAKGDADWGDS